jgi:hypothetical protein
MFEQWGIKPSIDMLHMFVAAGYASLLAAE